MTCIAMLNCQSMLWGVYAYERQACWNEWKNKTLHYTRPLRWCSTLGDVGPPQAQPQQLGKSSIHGGFSSHVWLPEGHPATQHCRVDTFGHAEIDKSGRLAVADMLDIPFQVRQLRDFWDVSLGFWQYSVWSWEYKPYNYGLNITITTMVKYNPLVEYKPTMVKPKPLISGTASTWVSMGRIPSVGQTSLLFSSYQLLLVKSTFDGLEFSFSPHFLWVDSLFSGLKHAEALISYRLNPYCHGLSYHS